MYMAGLSDEAGAAQPLAVAVKQLGAPSADQVSQCEDGMDCCCVCLY